MTLSKILSPSRKLHLKIFRMPRLSPSVSSGRIVKWFIPEQFSGKVGFSVNRVESYQLICKIACQNLTAPENQIASVEKEDLLDIEILEDGFVLKIFPHTENIKVDEPIAIIADEEEEVVNALPEDFVDKIVLGDYPTALWQAYLDSSSIDGKNGNCDTCN